MGLTSFFAPAKSKTEPSKKDSLLNQHLYYCNKTRQIAVGWIERSALFLVPLPKSLRDFTRTTLPIENPIQTTEADARLKMWWSDHELMESVVKALDENVGKSGRKVYIAYKIRNECAARCGYPVRTPFRTTVEEIDAYFEKVKYQPFDRGWHEVLPRLRTIRALRGPVISAPYDSMRIILRDLAKNLSDQNGFLAFLPTPDVRYGENDQVAGHEGVNYHLVHAIFDGGKVIPFCTCSAEGAMQLILGEEIDGFDGTIDGD